MNRSNTPKLAAGILMLVAFLTGTAALATEDTAEREIGELLDAFLAGASRNDIAMHDRFWAEDLVYTSSAGQRRSKAQTMAGLRAAMRADAEALPTYGGEDVDIRVFEDIAVVTFRLIAEMPDATVEEFFNTGVFARRDGEWRAFTWQATRIPSDATD